MGDHFEPKSKERRQLTKVVGQETVKSYDERYYPYAAPSLNPNFHRSMKATYDRNILQRLIDDSVLNDGDALLKFRTSSTIRARLKKSSVPYQPNPIEPQRQRLRCWFVVGNPTFDVEAAVVDDEEANLKMLDEKERSVRR
jgi:hypothetical protein